METSNLPAWEDPTYYASIRAAESGGKDHAVNNLSGATGRYQFMPKTWAGLMRRYPTLGLSVGGRTDPDQQEKAIRAFTRDNARSLERQGITVTKGALYAAHFLGAGDAPKALSASDDTPMSSIVAPIVITQNPHLRGMTAGGFRAWADRKAGSGGTQRSGSPISYDDVSAPRPVTNNELQDAEANKPDRSLWDTAKDAATAEWSMLYAFDGQHGLAPDPDFRLSAERLQATAKEFNIPTSRMDWLAQAHSEEHLAYLTRQFQDDAKREQRLAEAGGMGMALRFSAALLDPGAWAAGAAIAATTGGLGMPAAIAARFGMGGKVALGAAEGALANVSTDAITAAQKPITDDNMLLWSAGAGLVLGGALGGLRRTPLNAPEADALEAVGQSMQDMAVGLPGSGGAARNSAREALRLDTDEMRVMAEAYDDGGVALDWARFDTSAKLKGSSNPLTRTLGDVLVADPVGSKNRSRATPIAAEEVQKQLQVRAEVRWQRELQSAYQDFGKRNGFNWIDWDRQREAFNSEVTRFVRSADPMDEFDPAVTKAGTTFRNLMRSWAEHLNNPGLLDGGSFRPVKGAEELSPDAHYAPRFFDVRSIDERLSRFGNAQIEQLIEHAIRSKLDDVDVKLTKKVAKAYTKRLNAIEYGHELARGRALGGDDLDAFRREMLEGTDLSEEEIETLTKVLERPAKDGAKPRLKNRLALDENAGLVLTDQRTGEKVFTRFSDLLINDADHLMQRYSRWASGAVALARVKVKNPHFRAGEEAPEFLIDGITSTSDVEKLLEQVSAVGQQSGVDRAANKADVDRLRHAFDAIAGNPHPMDGQAIGQSLRMLRDYNFARVMGQVGMAQVPELASIAMQLGMKALWKGMPPLRALVRDLRSKRIGDELSEELELLTGTGTDWLRGASHARWDDFGNPMTLTGSNPVLVGADNLLRKGKRVTSAISGMAPVNTLLQRWVSRSMAQKFAQMALGETPNMNRVRALGIDEKMLDRISAELKAHASFEGRKLKRLNVEQWSDPEAGAAFRDAMFRGARRVIMENDVGNMAGWMNNPLARTLLQFRTFVVGSWSKVLLHNIHMNDFETYSTFMTSMFAGALTYLAQTHLNYATAPDRDEQLAKRLTPEAIAKAALQRSSWFSLFGPGVDTMGMFAGSGPVFDARTTGLPSNVLWGNPTMDLGDSLFKASGSIIQGIRDGEGTQAGVKNVTRTLPFQNFLPFVALTNVLSQDLPKYDHRD